jgi:hypothetical protein
MYTEKKVWVYSSNSQGVTQRCHLLTQWQIAPSYMSPNARGGGGLRPAGSQPMSTAVHRSPNKRWRSNSIFNLCYQAMPSLRGVAHDGWLCSVYILPYNSSWKFHQLAAGQFLSGQPVRYGKGRRYGLSSRKNSHLPDHSPPARQAGSRVGPLL